MFIQLRRGVWSGENRLPLNGRKSNDDAKDTNASDYTDPSSEHLRTLE